MIKITKEIIFSFFANLIIAIPALYFCSLHFNYYQIFSIFLLLIFFPLNEIIKIKINNKNIRCKSCGHCLIEINSNDNNPFMTKCTISCIKCGKKLFLNEEEENMIFIKNTDDKK